VNELAGKKKLSFEEALARLEEVIASLENNECELEESLSLFKEGMELVKFCRGKLSDTEKKISILVKEAGEFVAFESGGDS
jgi:exodeoxyribonuclease VII small subunit